MEMIIFYSVASAILLITAIVVITCRIQWKREDEMFEKLKEANVMIAFLHHRLKDKGSRNGVTDEATLGLAMEINRIENNLNGLGRNVPGSKYLREYVDNMKEILRGQGYELISQLGGAYSEEVAGTAVFLVDESVPREEWVITSVQRPQVNYCGKMIQAPHVTVGRKR